MKATIPETYYIVVDHGRLGRETVIDWEACTKRDAILAIVSGELRGRPLEVHCIDRDGGTWRDVSEDIARDIVEGLDEIPSGVLFDFLENALGCRFMADLERDMRAA